MPKKKWLREIAVTATLLSLSAYPESLEGTSPGWLKKHDTEQNKKLADEQQKKLEGKKTSEKIKTVAGYTDSLTMQTVEGSLGAVNPPHNQLDTGFFVTGEALFLKATEDDLNYVTKESQTLNTAFPQPVSSTNYVTADTLDPKFRWNWGARAGLGYQFEDFDSWDLYTQWTYVHGGGKNSTAVDVNAISNFFTSHTTPPETDFLYPTWGGGEGVTYGGFFLDDSEQLGVSQASAEWMLN